MNMAVMSPGKRSELHVLYKAAHTSIDLCKKSSESVVRHRSLTLFHVIAGGPVTSASTAHSETYSNALVVFSDPPVMILPTDIDLGYSEV